MAWRERNFWDGDGECPPGTLQVWAGGVTSSDRVPLGPVEPLLGSQPPPGSVLGVLGSLECRDRAVSAGSSLCLEPEKPPWEWTEIHWRAKKDPRTQERILTANRTGIVSRPKGSFQGRAEFRLEPLALCLSPVLRRDHGVYTAEFENSSGIFSRCFQVTVWDPIQEPSLKSQLLRRDPGWCLLSLLCSSPGNVSYTWTCPGDPVELSEFPEIPKFPEIPEFQSWIIRRVPEGAEPQNCRCNVSNPAGWRTASANLTCPGIPGNFSHWMLVTVALTLTLTLTLTLLLVGCCCWRRRRRKNSREGPPGGPPEQPLTLYAEVGPRKPRQEPEGATIYAVVNPRTQEHPRNWEKSQNLTLYSTVQFTRRPSSTQRKRLDRALISTAYLEDIGGYQSLGFPKPAGHQRP
ncbi:natural killer cell receptor 2B4 isoform X1 [Sylvia atricapilla]|uniref:natural killer cell receptor 2B4 isoform X1 n=1 Tax=Sylvia atricapilla TaxID=48155 RepID=UPI00339B40A8